MRLYCCARLDVSNLISSGHTLLLGRVVELENFIRSGCIESIVLGISKDRIGGGNQHSCLPFSTTQHRFLGYSLLGEGPEGSCKDPNLVLVGSSRQVFVPIICSLG